MPALGFYWDERLDSRQCGLEVGEPRRASCVISGHLGIINLLIRLEGAWRC